MIDFSEPTAQEKPEPNAGLPVYKSNSELHRWIRAGGEVVTTDPAPFGSLGNIILSLHRPTSKENEENWRGHFGYVYEKDGSLKIDDMNTRFEQGYYTVSIAIMRTPLSVDLLHNNRMEYIFSLGMKNSIEVFESKVTSTFSHGDKIEDGISFYKKHKSGLANDYLMIKDDPMELERLRLYVEGKQKGVSTD